MKFNEIAKEYVPELNEETAFSSTPLKGKYMVELSGVKKKVFTSDKTGETYTSIEYEQTVTKDLEEQGGIGRKVWKSYTLIGGEYVEDTTKRFMNDCLTVGLDISGVSGDTEEEQIDDLVIKLDGQVGAEFRITTYVKKDAKRATVILLPFPTQVDPEPDNSDTNGAGEKPVELA